MLSAKGRLTRVFAKDLIRKPNLLAASTGIAYSKARSCSQMPRGSPREFSRTFQRREGSAEGQRGSSRVLSRVLRAKKASQNPGSRPALPLGPPPRIRWGTLAHRPSSPSTIHVARSWASPVPYING